jgi:hypothetical protein
MCTVLLPPGVYPIAVNISYHIISYHIKCLCEIHKQRRFMESVADSAGSLRGLTPEVPRLRIKQS